MASQLSVPSCRFSVVASQLSLSSCRFQVVAKEDWERVILSAMFAKLVLFFLFTCSFGNCTLPSLPDSAITGTLKKGFHAILFVLKFNSVAFFLKRL